jgi:hypothetical protein
MTNKFRASLALMVLLSCIGCGNRFEKVLEGRVLASSVSPSGKMEARYVLPDLGPGLGATISQPYQVQLRSLHPEAGETMLIMGGDQTSGLRLKWRNNDLEICYSEARILRFRNKFDIFSRDHKTQLDELEIVLHKVNKLDEC